MKKIQFKVSVRCLTYNQAPYILDTLDGFAMQQTTFPFVCTIVDDYSSDGEQEAIQRYIEQNFDLSDADIAYQRETEYAHITFARHNTNSNCYFAILYLKYNHYSLKKNKLPYLAEWLDDVDYAALCEGDDYWIDPLKLQKQVDFLETHPEYSACVHRCKCLNCKTNSFGTSFPNETQERDFSINEIILGGGGFWGTNTVVCRPVFLPDYEAEFWKLSPVGDFPHALSLATHGKIHYLPQEMSVYRLFAKGSWSSRTMIGPEAYNRRSTHVSKMRESLKAFDKHTNFEFSKFIQEKIDLNDFNLYWDFGKWSLLKTTSHYKRRPFIGKLKALYHCISIFFKKSKD